MAIPARDWLEEAGDGSLRLLVKVLPGASRTEVAGLRDGRLLVRVAAAQEKGKANDALVAWLARELGLPRAAVSILAGATDRRKTIGLPAAAAAALRGLIPGEG